MKVSILIKHWDDSDSPASSVEILGVYADQEKAKAEHRRLQGPLDERYRQWEAKWRASKSHSDQDDIYGGELSYELVEWEVVE